jgi:hypothetical protein
MKQIYVMTSALLVAISTQAQFQTIDFEELILPAIDTFYTGADDAGQFVSQDVIFNNFYEETAWGYSWSGFAYSNMTDNTTPGLSNQYSAFAGEGASGSEKYAIYYAHDTLTFPGVAADFGNVAITNTTYAGISMREGDQFAKQFGSPNDANGDPDGTDGKDFFFVTIRAWDNNWNYIDSIDIYLADFQSENANDHYILEDWEYFDLSVLNQAKYFTFNFTSSDVGQFGMNTPAYFALDNLEFAQYVNDVNENQIEIGVYPNPAKEIVNVKGGEGIIKLFDQSGRLMLTKEHKAFSTLDVHQLPQGLCFIHLEGENGSAVQKLIIQ